MLIYKILLASIIVIVLSEIAERSNPKVASILAGLPIGLALVLFFYGMDFGTQYVEQAVPYNLLGLTASLSFVIFYYFGSKLSDKYSITFGFLSGISVFLLSAYILSFTTVYIPAIILLSLIFFSRYIFGNVKEIKKTKKNKTSFSKIVLRGAMATFFVVSVSYAPHYVNDSIVDSSLFTRKGFCT